MKKILPLVFALTFCLFSAKSHCAQDFPYEKYDPRTLSELTEMGEESSKAMPPDKGQMLINGKPFYSTVRVTFIGTAKHLTTDEKEYLKIWQQSLGYDEKVLALFETKYLFKECDKEYWIPVQKQVAGYFPKELKSGDVITLYLMFPGGLKLKPANAWNFIFLVNEFEKYEE